MSPIHEKNVFSIFSAIFLLGFLSSTQGGALRNKRHIGYVQVESFVPSSEFLRGARHMTEMIDLSIKIIVKRKACNCDEEYSSHF